jgi:hypothetical protein
LRGPDVTLSADIPTVRCSIPTREQGDLRADPDVLRTINAHADRCLGVYATVEQGGLLAEEDALEFEPPRQSSAAAKFARERATRLKRGTLRAFDALMPRGE